VRLPRKLRQKLPGPKRRKVPGPSTNPATNLLIMDVALRGAALLVARAIERNALRMRYSEDTAGNIVKGRSMAQTLAVTGAARTATRSVPGLLLVAGGLLAKSVVDRSLSRGKSPRKVRRKLGRRSPEATGDKALLEQAQSARDE
jgi:hypothetical protein